MNKKTIIFYSNAAWLRTGFGKNARNILSYLYKTGKYNLINVCGQIHCTDPKLQKSPWLSIPGLPDNLQELKNVEQDPRLHQLMQYGDSKINNLVNEHKADAVIACEDPWSINFDQPFWNSIPSILWTTLDSLPIIPLVTQNMSKFKPLWVWSNFAEKELKKLGFDNVETVHGPIDSVNFYKVTANQKIQLLNKYNLPPNAFVISFVFRNQYRKSVDKLIEGYKIFKNQNPQVKNTYLLLHTSFWGGGWDIPTLIREFDVNPHEVLCTYICPNCKEYEIKPYNGEHQDCRFCGLKGIAPNQEHQHGKGQVTIHPNLGISEEQLNEVYNISSLYCHAFNSGGQEIPIQEAKLCELVTLVTNYSCGAEMCEPDAYSLLLEYSIYKDLNQSQFNKAVTYPSSIAKQIYKAYFMKPEKLAEMGRKGREWVLENFAIEKIGKKIEDWIDNQPPITYNYTTEYKAKNAEVQIPAIEDDIEWIKSLYKNILNMEDGGDGITYWQNDLKRGNSRQNVEEFFRQTARNDNQKNLKTDFGDLLIKNDKKNLAVVQPQSIGDLIGLSATFKSLRQRYPSDTWNFYMITEQRYFEIFEGNPYIDKLLPFDPQMDNSLAFEGIGTHKGFFDIMYSPYKRPQRLADYTHNGADLIDLNLK